MEIKCECEAPSLNGHLKRAAAMRHLELKSAEKILELAFKKVVDNGRHYNDCDFKLSDIFEEPGAYLKEKAEEAAEKAKHSAATKRTLKFSKSLIDKINLNKYEDGETAIAEMLAFV